MKKIQNPSFFYCLLQFKNNILNSCIIIFLFAFFSQALFAAAPITHAVLAEQWIALHEKYNDEQKKSFILGTLFPDIRYLKVITRDKTHEKGVTVQKLLSKQSPFTKGKRLHAFVDKEREKLVVKWKIYDKIKNVPGQRYKATFLKLLEDEILFSNKNWAEIRGYLVSIDPEEMKFGIAEQDIKRWHHNQLMAFTSAPSQYLTVMAMLDKGYGNIPAPIIKEWSKILPKYAKKKEIIHYVDNLLASLDNIFQDK